MLQGKTIIDIFNMGGFAMYLLLVCSILSVAVIVNRFFVYKSKSKIIRIEFMDYIKGLFNRNDIEGILEFCKETKSPFSKIASAAFSLYNNDEKEISSAVERAITIEIIKLERYTSIVGTIGNIAVYIGLFGTVIGIMRAFSDMSLSGVGGISVVVGGVSQALITTAAGLIVAVPAVIFYNYFVKKIDNFVSEMELCSSELVDIIERNNKS